jgi:hypothetical protein
MRGFSSGALGVTLVVALIGGAVGLWAGYAKTDGGEVAVVRNGGWFDNNRIRQVIQPASGLTWVGMWSKVHRYPAQQRYYTMTADPERGGRPGIDLARSPSSDGVEMGIEATMYFTLNLDPGVLKTFDEKYGTRQFRYGDDDLLYAWDGVEGWNAFFDGAVRPVIDNALRFQLSTVSCAELVSSCALVQFGANGAAAPTTTPTAAVGAGQNNANISKIESALNESLAHDIERNLGGPFLQGIKFNLVRVTLPGPVQEAVTKAQAAFAAVSEAQAKVAQAQAEAEANKKRQEGYNACPSCAQIDMIKALPPGVTTYAPGNGVAVGR